MAAFFESPAKRLKTRESSPDALDDAYLDLSRSKHQTIATVPAEEDFDSDDSLFDTLAALPVPAAAQAAGDKYHTQPTQLIARCPPSESTLSTPKTTVQVAASSPTQGPSSMPIRRPMLASAMAPAGTAFRAPVPGKEAPKAKPPVVYDVSDDDGPRYAGGSSDSDMNIRKNDIKTSSFGKKTLSLEKIEESPQSKLPSNKFQQITKNSFYRPGAKGSNLSGSVYDSRNKTGGTSINVAKVGAAVKRSSDVMANAYGGTSRKVNRSGQVKPARALPVSQGPKPDIALDDIPDYNIRQKVKQMKSILTSQTIGSCYEALLLKKMRFDDAVDYLVAEEENVSSSQAASSKHIDLTGSEDDLAPTPVAAKFQQKSKAPLRSIHDKWGPTQLNRSSQSQAKLRTEAEMSRKKGQRLRQGHRPSSSPAPDEMPQLPKKPVTTIAAQSDSDENDSVMSSATSDIDFEGRVLSFFNDSSATDLADTTGMTAEIAELFVSKRPFKTLEEVRKVQQPSTSSKTRKRNAQIGVRLVEKAEDMLEAYEAVDALVQQCEDLGRPIAQEIATWGVSVYGSNDGSISMTSSGNTQSTNHDSGIGTPISGSEDDQKNTAVAPAINIPPQPASMSQDIVMKDYQLVGVNWLALLHSQGLNSILADDMGLGKTCQVIAFLAHLREEGQDGPHLVVVPASTIENWLTEFKKFCPDLAVAPYYGTKKERIAFRDEIEENRKALNVVVTTYTIAKTFGDNKWLREFGFYYTIFDEGHVLKNVKSQVYHQLIRIRSEHRLLLTGTPLQNNLQELVSLLAFIMPDTFQSSRDELEAIFSHKVSALNAGHEALLSTRRIARARSMLTPFILRRKKQQVLKHLPKKLSRIEVCDLTSEQAEVYIEYLNKVVQIKARRETGENVGNETSNVLIRLRQAAISPLLFGGKVHNGDQLHQISELCLQIDQWTKSNSELILLELQAYSAVEIHKLCAPHSILRKFCLKQDDYMASGKAQKLVELLMQFKKEGHRTLIFSQFIMVMDIIELILDGIKMPYMRLDGTTPVSMRQELINEFNAEDCKTNVFMLSTKAGGAGINLATANKVIIFDSGFNPQDDIQAENRAHRIGQQKDVEVIRLVTKGTVEEQIYAMGLTKLALDEKVAGDEEGAEEDKKEAEKKIEEEGQKMVEQMLFETLGKSEADAEMKE